VTGRYLSRTCPGGGGALTIAVWRARCAIGSLRIAGERCATRFRSRVRSFEERDFRLIGDRIVDLSTSGMLVTPADPVLTGERVIASFRLPNSTYWIDVEGTVVARCPTVVALRAHARHRARV